ncbi:MAG: 3D domain-containing protein [Minicystis sp.]
MLRRLWTLSSGVALLVLALTATLLVPGCGPGEESLGTASEELLSNNTHYNGFTFTDYVVAQESQLSGQHTGDSSYVCPPGLNGACYHKEFLCSGWGVVMQGTGLASDGKYIKYVGGGGPWTSGYVWWQNCSSTSFAFVSGVTGASGRTLVANYSIAVDTSNIPLGWYVWIDSLNRWYRADDTGGAITGYHIDVYTGTSNPNYNFTGGIYLTQTAHAATDPSPYGGGGSPWCSASCAGGGWWCWNDGGCIQNGVAGHNYHCPGNNTAPDRDQACALGCNIAAAGSPDYCKYGSFCGGGAWCGNDCVNGNASTLYNFTAGGALSSVTQCSVGYANGACKIAAAGSPDYCY